ncbi:MAG TPA: hypothetical protein VFV08_09735, partial [Puia sp.]|nr:hypothetical protein [Puia sp.]
FLTKINSFIFNFSVVNRFISYIFILLGLAVLFVSNSEGLMEKITQKRSAVKGPFGIHHSDAGDLVSMGYLDDVKKFQEPYDYLFTKSVDTLAPKNIDLYIYGDSYLIPVPDSAFHNINSYHFGRRSVSDLTYNLDPHKKNILIIEYAERFARGEFHNFNIYEHVKKETGKAFTEYHSNLMEARLLSFHLFNSDINRNLEYNLYGYSFWDPVKLSKASLTYHFFKRAVGNVVVSKDGSRLFLRETTASNGFASSYYPFSDKEFQEMVGNINSVYDHYKSEGFDEIYLSIIPNPVTVIQPDHYNGLIPRLQQPGVLNGTRIINVYNVYSQDPDPGRFYRIGDTHWNNNGLQVWLKVVNEELKKQSLSMHEEQLATGH